MEVLHQQQLNKGAFYIQEAGETLARMTYTQPDSSKLIIEHTQVADEIRHQDAGYQMVQTAVDYARDRHLKIVPVCPFVKAVFDKKPEYKDVLQQAD